MPALPGQRPEQGGTGAPLTGGREGAAVRQAAAAVAVDCGAGEVCGGGGPGPAAPLGV